VLSGDETGTVKLWELGTGKLLRTFKGNGRAARVVAFAPDGRKLLAGTHDNKIRIWDAGLGREVKTLRMLVGPVLAMAVSADGRRVAGGPYSALMAKQWDIETGKELRRLESNYNGRFVGVADIKYSAPSGHTLAATSNNYIVLWDIDSGRKKLEVNSRDQDFKSIAFSNDGRRLVSLDNAGVVRHWDKTTGSLVLTVVSFGDGEWVRVTPEGFFDASPNGTNYLSVAKGLEVYSID
jgi:WD40 repeat protein